MTASKFGIVVRSQYSSTESAWKLLAKKFKKPVPIVKQNYKYLNQYILIV